MHNTLEEFYKYLAGSIFDYLSNKAPAVPGERYFIHFQNEEDVAACSRHLIAYHPEFVSAFDFQYNEESKPYAASQVRVGNAGLIIASCVDATENFLTLLRNQVAEQQGPFAGKAILILFSGQLDSLVGGSGDLTKSGMPLSFDYFEQDILGRLRETFKDQADKRTILELAFKEKRSEFRLGELSIFDFNHIVAIIQSGSFGKQDYQLVGLFPHAELVTMTDSNRIREKIEENNELFELIENVVNFGNVQTDLDRVLTPAGIGLIEAGLADGNWKLEDYADVAKLKLKPDREKPVEYEGLERNLLNEGFDIWERRDQKNGRLRHVIIFNRNGIYPVRQRFNFNGILRGKLSINGDGNGTATVEKTGKQIELQATATAFNENQITFEYQDFKVPAVRYQFRVWIINGVEGLLLDFKAKYAISIDGQLLLDAEEALRLNPGADETESVELVADGHYQADDGEGLTLRINSEDDETIGFTLDYREQTFSVCVKQQIGVPSPVKGWDVWQNKRIREQSFSYTYSPDQETLKILLENEEFAPREDYRKNLLLEIAMMERPATAWLDAGNNILEPRPLRLSEKLATSYFAYLDQVRAAETLPSLYYPETAGRVAAIAYVDTFLAEVAAIGEDEILAEDTQADLLLLGSVTETYGGQAVRLSPLHPLMVAYQLELSAQVGRTKLHEAMLRKLTPLNLLPYFYWKTPAGGRQLYASKENNHSPEWQYYSSDLQFKQFSGREFIRGLVSQKIHEFITNFFFLFSHDRRAPLRINVFNMGDCLHILQGTFDYYKDRALAGESLHDLRPVTLYLYGSENYVTTFEKMSHLIAEEDIERSFELGSTSKRLVFDDLLNAFRDKVRYYAMGPAEEQQYAHLTFYQFDNTHTGITNRDFRKIPSGLSLNGLVADLPSNYQDKTYVTGFGAQFVLKANQLIDTAKAYNALGLAAFSKDPFGRERTVCTTIDHAVKYSLDDLYDHSQWVVFVDPHFDLTFFKDVKDLIIVHYSDQYSNASGFDAITVSRKSRQYSHMLEGILRGQQVSFTGEQVLQVINLYNAINGQWLIKMIGKKDEKTRKEKLSIPAAAKLFLAYFDHPDITWVPVSLEEILRVSGGAGLSKSEGLFSASNLGAKNEHGDDLLMIGLYEKDGQLCLQFYPVEVKIGINPSDTLNKGRLQGQKTWKLIYEHLTDDSKAFEAAFYRSFFAKLAIMNASKMALYEVWPAKDCSVVTEKYRSRLLNDEFVVTGALSAIINNFAVIAFTKSAYIRDYQLEEQGVMLTHFEEDAYSYLVDDVDTIKNWLFNMPNSIDLKQLLVNKLPGVDQLIAKEVPLPGPPAPELPESAEDESVPASLTRQIEADEEETETRPPLRILFGNNINNGEQVYWYPTDTTQVMHSNTGIIGTMGTGKTQFTKSLVTQLCRESKCNVWAKPIGLLIFDYKGDYIGESFVQATGAKVYELYDLPFNPLSIDMTPASIPLLPLHIASTLQETISLAFGLGPKQKALLKDVIMAAYEQKGIYKADRATWTKIAPTISDVYDNFINDPRMSMDSLYAALNQLYEYQIFQPDGNKTKSLFELIDGVTVINLSGGYSADLQNLVVAITLDAFYSQMQKAGHSLIDQNFRQLTRMILVDEADNFLSKNFVSIRKILKEGREFGVGTLLSTQFLNHFSTGDNEYAQYILTWIVHRVNDIKQKDVESLFPVIDKDQKEQLIQLIKRLEKHHSVVNLAGSKPIFIEDYPFWKLVSS